MNGKRVLIIIGIILFLIGGVWASQGAGMLGTGSFMDNNPTWLYLGSAFAIVGILLLVFGVIPRSRNVPAN